MKRSDLSEFEIQEEGFKLRIKRGNGPLDSQPTIIHTASAIPVAPVNASPETSALESAGDDGLEIIASPMVGTFYRSSSPEGGPFVEKNASVSSDTIVCIIEAMKVMNEIQAEVSGTIVEVLVENEQSVEYGQPLFKVKPS